MKIFASKLQEARSLLYGQLRQREQAHFLAFFEIYKIYNPLHRSDLEISAKNRPKFWWNEQISFHFISFHFISFHSVFSDEFGNFRRLFLGCIDTSDSESRRIFQDFSKSTRSAFFCTAPDSNFQQNLAILLKFRDLSGAKDCKSCRSRKMRKNAPTLAI